MAATDEYLQSSDAAVHDATAASMTSQQQYLLPKDVVAAFRAFDTSSKTCGTPANSLAHGEQHGTALALGAAVTRRGTAKGVHLFLCTICQWRLY